MTYRIGKNLYAHAVSHQEPSNQVILEFSLHHRERVCSHADVLENAAVKYLQVDQKQTLTRSPKHFEVDVNSLRKLPWSLELPGLSASCLKP